MLEIIGHIERYVVRRLSPAALERFDKWLRLHHPLVWRTRIHWIIWWIVVPSTAWFAIVFLGPRPTADILNGPALLTYGTMFAFSLSCGGVALWSSKQIKTPLGERRWASRVSVTLTNTGIVAALFLPLWITILPLTHLVAHSVPSAAFYEELQFHREHDYWRCLDHGKGYAVISENRQRLDASLALFGMRTRGELAPERCSPETDQGVTRWTLQTWNTGSSEKRNPNDTEELQRRLEAIAYSKQLWQEHDGRLFDVLANDYVKLVFMIAMGVSMLLVARDTPRYIIDRFLARYVPYGRIEPSRLHPRLMPAWLAKLDRHLLLRRPVFWATRAHIAAFYSVCWLATLVTAGLLMPEALARTRLAESIVMDGILLNVGLSALGLPPYLGLSALGLPVVWALSMRRGDVAAVRPAASQQLVDGFCLAVLPLPIAHGPLLLLWISPADSTDLFHAAVDASYMVFVGLLVLSLSLIRNYRSGKVTFAATYAGCLAMELAVGVHDHFFGSILQSEVDRVATRLALIAIALVAAFGIVARRTRNVNAATLLIVLAPTLVAYLGLTLITLDSGVWAVIAPPLTAYPIYRYAVAPLITVLAGSRHRPQAR
jgi:hypothetical protein